MSTWNVITVTGAPHLTERKFEKAIARSGLCLSDEQVFDEGGTWKVCGNSKYEAEGLHSLADDLSARHPGARVEVSEEWDNRDADESGQSVDVYVCGERVTALGQVNGLVPVDLVQSIKAVREALGGSGDLATAALWLVDGLDGSR